MYFAFALLTGIVVYYSLMANNLVNNIDGIWHPSNFIAGDWEISLGRGLQRYADRARFGLVSNPWNSILVFALFGITDCFIIKKFRMEKTFFSFLFVFITIANPIMGESLSYSYMSVNFACAYLFSVLAFYYISDDCSEIKRVIMGMVISSVCFAISMAFYQAYICVYAVLCVFLLILKFKKNENTKEVIKTIGLCLFTFLTGGLLYLAITKILLFRAGVQMASYRGAENAGLLTIVKNLPQSIVGAYRETFGYFITGRLNANLEFSGIMILLVCLVLLMASIGEIIGIIREKKPQRIPIILLLAILPMASSIICIIAPGNEISGLMAMGVLIGILLFFLLAEDKKYMRIIMSIAYVVMAWYLVSAVENDQIALREGMVATRNMAENALSEMYSEDLLSEVRCVAFVGRTAENPLFYKSTAYEMANGYAQFGRWSTDPRNNMVTWIGITETMCGASVPICGVDTYSEIVYTDVVSRMPIYPTKGYMKVIDDVLVVKMSNLY